MNQTTSRRFTRLYLSKTPLPEDLTDLILNQYISFCIQCTTYGTDKKNRFFCPKCLPEAKRLKRNRDAKWRRRWKQAQVEWREDNVREGGRVKIWRMNQ